MKCPTCNGEGGWREQPYDAYGWWQYCPRCDMTGKIGLKDWFYNEAIWMLFPDRLVEAYIDWRWKLDTESE